MNQDHFGTWPDLGLYVVADGMGGHNAGEVASQLALDTIRAFLRKSASSDDFTWPFGVSPTLSFAANRLMTAIKVANRRVFRASEERTEYTGMGTTVVAAIFEGARISFSGVGDSRIYSFDGSELTQITRDDSWVVMLMKESGLDASAFEKHPMRHVLTNVIGARDQVDVHVQEFPVAPGDRLLLCSDGLHEPLGDERMASLLADALDARSAAATLVQTALDRGSRDNVTALVVAVEDGE